ncbi:hypothetical protein ABT001_31770 [Streptomyces sp. NPDC002793]|uniref:hypothetical protein n=1 Tax=Streptomyces sp. NPDC002793 TaxID=3154432 RepID=UPI00333213EE
MCLEFKVENSGSTEFDASCLARACLVGEDGEVENVDQVIGTDCAGLGVEKNSFLDEPAPHPDEFVHATTVLMVPDAKPGTLEFADGFDRPLFKVDVPVPGSS